MEIELIGLNKLLHALEFASIKHENQKRKNAIKSPYINHPINVCRILTDAGVSNVDVLCAGVLHDTLEDTETTFEELANLFGENVASIVNECTDDKSLDKVSRKKLQVIHAQTISNDAKLVKLADKYSNLSCTVNDPPINWSNDQVSGYIYWSYDVVSQMKGLNSFIDAKFEDLFQIFLAKSLVTCLDIEHVKLSIEQYYKIL